MCRDSDFFEETWNRRVEAREKLNRQKRAVKTWAFHKFFHLFPELPTEIRIIIWKLSLTPRAVEIQWSKTRGFFSRVPTPIALSICQDSRDAVKSNYPLCFGDGLYDPRTVFNFSLDTLYVDNSLQSHSLLLIASLSSEEVAKIKYLAVDAMIDDDFGSMIDCNLKVAYTKLASNMPALVEYLEVHNLVDRETHIKEFDVTMELFEDWPFQIWWRHDCGPEFRNQNGEWFPWCACDRLKKVDEKMAGLKGPKVDAIWGWRPIKSLSHYRFG